MQMDYVLALSGGLLIGLAASLMLIGTGRITGISGIATSLLRRPTGEEVWRYLFLMGLVIGGFGFISLRADFFQYSFNDSPIRSILAGLLVGVGTRMSGGCTSGHGVCGISRLSNRSILATLIFIFFGILTTFLMRFLL